ncbi:MAG: Fur family transcriptional regulator [Anaerolineae bacterium]
MTKTSVERAEERLKAAGKYLTQQRRLILEIIQESDEHLDAEAIYLRGKPRDPTLSLSTVYRTLNLLKELDLVEQCYFARDHQRERFEAKDAPEHYHFTCRRCGQIIEFETGLITEIRENLERKFGVDVAHSCICFEGLCADCREDEIMSVSQEA